MGPLGINDKLIIIKGNKQVNQMMNDYGMGSGNSQTRKAMKSPTSTALSLKNIDQAKHLKRKYDQVKHAVISKRQQNQRLQQKVKQMQQVYAKRQKQIEKKDSIHDALLCQIELLRKEKEVKVSSLKSVSVENSKSKGGYLLSADHDKYKTKEIHFSTASQDQSKESSAQKVGGYFGSVFK